MSDQQNTVVNVQVGAPPAGQVAGIPPANQKSTGVAFVLWFLFGTLGGHRFYLNRPHAAVMLILWILSAPLAFVVVGFFLWGGLLIWALVDAFSIQKWVQEYNTGLMSGGMLPAAAAPAAVAPEERPKDLSIRLLEEAKKRRGRLTVTQGVVATEEPFAEVEKCLQGMVDSGYVDVENEPESGVVVYVFDEMT